MKAASIMEHLLLQKATRDSTSKRNKGILRERIEQWKRGDIHLLTASAKTIQERLQRPSRSVDPAKIARTFARMMFTCRTADAPKLLDDQAEGGRVLPLTRSLQKTLRELHPDPGEVDDEALLKGDLPKANPIIYEDITPSLIETAALRTKGSHGPSGGDATHWKRMVLSFGKQSARLREAMAGFGKRICTDMEPTVLEAFLANRLVALDKCPGVRPVGIGESPRRIIGKGIAMILKMDIEKAAGVHNMCAGQSAGIEALIHAMTEAYDLMSTEAVLLADASNAFNRLNRKVALHNIRYICPSLSTALNNIYGKPTRLFVMGGFELSSQEGTTQGCPLAMAMYALGIIPLIKEAQTHVPNKQDFQGWLADDSQAVGRLTALKQWWDVICEKGPRYGYFPKPGKSYLVVKPDKIDEAKKVFQGTGVHVVLDAQRDLGAVIGIESAVNAKLRAKVSKWASQVKKLAEIAATQPHAAHAAFTFGLRHRWTFLQRAMPPCKTSYSL